MKGNLGERMKKCPYCAEDIREAAIRCKFCKSDLPAQTAASVEPYNSRNHEQGQERTSALVYGRKNRVTAGVLGILLGGLGVHKFYLGQIGWGILYLVFLWTYIPAILGLIEGIRYLTM